MNQPHRHKTIPAGGAPRVAGFEFVAATDHHIVPSSDEGREPSHALFYIGGVIIGLLVVFAGWMYLDTLDAKHGQPRNAGSSRTPLTQAASQQTSALVPSKRPDPVVTNKESSRLGLGPALPMHTLERPPSTIYSPRPRTK